MQTAVLRTYDGTSLRSVMTAATPMTVLAVLAVRAVLDSSRFLLAPFYSAYAARRKLALRAAVVGRLRPPS
jgi:hypothetical protein